MEIAIIKKMPIFIVTMLLGFGEAYIYSQTPDLEISDSLFLQDYDTLSQKFWNAFDNGEGSANLYARAYLTKAKDAQDSIEIGRGFEYLAQISEPEQNIAFADSLIQYTLNSNHPNYPAVGYALKGYWNYDLGNYEEALNNYLLANKSAKKKNNVDQQIEVNQVIGVLKSAWGNPEEALELYKEHLAFIKSQPDYLSRYREDYLITLHNLSLAQIRDHNYLAAGTSINEGYAMLDPDEDPMYVDFLFASGITLFFQGQTAAAKDSIDKAVPHIQDNTDLAVAYYYKGMLTGNQMERLRFFQKVDSLYANTKIEFPELRTVYETFVDHYRSEGNERSELKYLKKLIAIDSLLAHNREYLNSTIIQKYDTPELIAQKNKLIQSLSDKNSNNQNLIIFISLGLIAVVALTILFFRRTIVLKKRFIALQNRPKQNSNSKEATPKKELSPRKRQMILQKLEDFEERKGFVSSEITLFSLSKIINYNQGYLSQTINMHKGKTYTAYINDLRIEYALDRLNNDPIFRKYKIQSIAEEVGFNTAETFSRAFRGFTGMRPSYFIKRLNDKQ